MVFVSDVKKEESSLFVCSKRKIMISYVAI